MSLTMYVRSITRTEDSGQEDTLKFTNGINTIVGPPNSGKTKWLQMLSFVLGDRGTPEDAFSQELAEKYKSLHCDVRLGDTDYVIERHWKEGGKKGKVCVNGTWIDAKEFSSFVLSTIGIPELHYPQGNPFSERSWPELSWRILFRHIYREQRFWSDIADKQPESEQHAALAQFLGVAEFLFPQELGREVEQRKALYQLQARKEQYQELLDQVSAEVLASSDVAIVVTLDTLNDRIDKCRREIDTIERQRLSLLQTLGRAVATNNSEHPLSDVGLAQETSWVERNRRKVKRRVSVCPTTLD
jgi:hypothetical protein